MSIKRHWLICLYFSQIPVSGAPDYTTHGKVLDTFGLALNLKLIMFVNFVSQMCEKNLVA